MKFRCGGAMLALGCGAAVWAAELPVEVRGALERALAGGGRQGAAARRRRGRRARHGEFLAELAAAGLGSLEFERLSRVLHRAIAEPLRERMSAIEVFTEIEGAPLHELLGRTPGHARAALASRSEAGRIRSLSTRSIAVSPGHGYYLNGSSYVLQRGYWQGIVEDFVNHDIVTLLAEQLGAAGADVRPTRNLDRAAGNGETGFPKWQEAAALSREGARGGMPRCGARRVSRTSSRTSGVGRGMRTRSTRTCS